MVTPAGSYRTRENEGVRTVEMVCVGGLLGMGGESSTPCVEICWRWVHWQRGVG